ncbi:MAG: helix-turn-helix domain-containing protein, partial [Eubacteriales bacterium]|nr:helix-turn-helix domain-containing protein [Eubacteriales bacterium]
LALILNCNAKFFKKIFDKKAQKLLPYYIAKIRIDKAKEMILETNLTDDIIALKLGFDDVTVFRKTFKKIEGCLAGDFRYIHKDLKSKSHLK